MNLGNIFQPRNQKVNSTNGGKVVSTSSDGHSNRIQAEIRNFKPGQQIQGEIVSKEGNTVQIAVDKDMVLSARLERDLNIALGQNMNFEVKSSSGSMISLTPLYANMANEATILKALSAAGLSQTADNVQMVSLMMQEGMAINKESIAQVSRQLADFPQADMSSVIQMIRLGLPITELNLEQFEQYKSYHHQMQQSIDLIMQELPQVGMELLAEGRDAQAVAFYEQIIKTFAGGEHSETAITTGTLEEISAPQIQEENLPDKILITEANDGQRVDGESLAAQKEILQGQAEQTENLMNMANGSEKNMIMVKNGKELAETLQKLGMEENQTNQVETAKISAKEFLSQIGELLEKASHSEKMFDTGWKEAFRELIENKDFQNVLKTEVGNQWLLKPEEVADKEKVEQFYERIREQTNKVEETLQMVGKADSTAAEGVRNLQSNVDFMNQLNQLFTYVQLPLKMAGNEAHGDLYVYTNKKNLASKEGSVSALLHLDMEHLGPLDVYVTMKQSKVSTNFTVQDEAVLDLIEEHVHLLDERLAKRGYTLHTSMQLKDKEEETNVMQEMLSQSKNISLLSSTSFDMRA